MTDASQLPRLAIRPYPTRYDKPITLADGMDITHPSDSSRKTSRCW